MQKKTIPYFAGISFIVVLALFAYLRNTKQTKELSLNGKISIGKMSNFEAAYRGRTGFTYSFYYQNVVYEGFYATAKNVPQFAHRLFPIIFDPSDPANCDMLIFPSDFELYSLPFPDSLNWVVPFQKYR